MDWKWEKVGECIERRFLSGESLTVAQFRLRQGCVVPRHSHPNEQISVVLEGVLEFEIGGKKLTLSAGDAVPIPPGVEHEARALTDVVGVDAFSPPRRDWLK